MTSHESQELGDEILLQEEVRGVISTLKIGKSPNIDNILTEFLKYDIPKTKDHDNYLEHKTLAKRLFLQITR